MFDEALGMLAIDRGADDFVPDDHFDAYSLTRAVKGMLEINAKEDALFEEKERAEKLMNQQALHEKQMAQKAHAMKFVDRFRATASKARQAQSRLKAIEKMDIVDAVIAAVDRRLALAAAGGGT